jgi:hypothetical protein
LGGFGWQQMKDMVHAKSAWAVKLNSEPEMICLRLHYWHNHHTMKPVKDVSMPCNGELKGEWKRKTQQLLCYDWRNAHD